MEENIFVGETTDNTSILQVSRENSLISNTLLPDENKISSSSLYNPEIDISSDIELIAASLEVEGIAQENTSLLGISQGGTIVGDADTDGDLDFDDVSAIFGLRNTPSSGPGDPLDLDGDGAITVLDGRQAVVLITENTDQIAPEISANLLNDTGSSDSDGITDDPTITGIVTDDSLVTRVWANLNSTTDLVDITNLFDANGDFTLTPEDLASINEGTLFDGDYTLYIQAKDQWANLSNFVEVNFTLQTTTTDPFFLSNIEFSEEGLFLGEAAEVTFSVDVANPSGAVIEVFELDNQGNQTLFGQLYDDGDLAKGDDIAGDGVFNNRFDLTPTSVGELGFLATIDSTGEETSPTSLEVIAPITDAEFQAILDFNTQINSQFQSLLDSGETVEDSLAQIQSTLEASPEVEQGSIVVLPNSIAWETQEGIGIVLDANEYLNDGQRGGDLTGESVYASENSFSSNSIASLAALANNEGCNNAIVLAPYAWQFEPFDESNEVAQDLQDAGFDVVEKRNTTQNAQNISVSDFKNLDEYDAIVITTHGDNFDGTNFGNGNEVVIFTGEKANLFNYIGNLFDLLSGRLVLGGGNTYAITPSFITKHTEDMPDSIVYVGSCRSTFTNSLANAFISEGADAFIGYSDYVGSGFANTRGQRVFDTLLDGKTTGDIPGINSDVETDSDPARFDLIGSNTATISLASLKNGTFENGDLKCWTTEGDTRVISALGPLSPPEGNRMAIISTGLGSVNDSQSSISQKFLVPDNADDLKLTYNVISEEPLEFVGTEFDDQFQVLLEGNIIAQETVNTSNWIPISGIDFAGGDDTVFQTGFKTISVDLSAYKGQIVEIEIKTFDAGDSIYDTAAVVDKIEITTT